VYLRRRATTTATAAQQQQQQQTITRRVRGMKEKVVKGGTLVRNGGSTLKRKRKWMKLKLRTCDKKERGESKCRDLRSV
jgi:hypothetical protein